MQDNNDYKSVLFSWIMHQLRKQRLVFDEKVNRAFLRYVSNRLKKLNITSDAEEDGRRFSYGGFSYAVFVDHDVISVDMRSKDGSVSESKLAEYVETEVHTNNIFRDGEPFCMYSEKLDEFRRTCRRLYDGKPSIKCEVLRMPSRRGTLFERIYDCVVRPALFVSRYHLKHGTDD